MIKKLDQLLIKGFIGPFVVTFFIACFVLMMQKLWLFIDDIVGKGAGLLFIIEMIFYLSVALIPMALPIAVLISSVMVIGNHAERYELSSMKSAGISLWRIMWPLMALALLISAFSFVCSNYLMPVANLKFRSRLYDIKKQKPTLSLEEGLFNEDFSDFVIHIKKKGRDNRSIEEVLIYNKDDMSKGKINQISAETGEMYTTDDEQFFVMNLKKGIQYEEWRPDHPGKEEKKKPFPFVRTSFEEWNKVFDLTEFDIRHTDEKLFSKHHLMLSTPQLIAAIDTMELQMRSRREGLANSIGHYFYPVKIEKRGVVSKPNLKEGTLATELKKRADSLKTEQEKSGETEEKKDGPPKIREFEKLSQKFGIGDSIKLPEIRQYGSILDLLPKDKRPQYFQTAKSTVRKIMNQSKASGVIIQKTYVKRIKHIFELHIKFALAMVCFIFLFIGAPMGAIIRKGGFGYPILISILFFMLYIVMNIAFKNVAEKEVMSPVLAAWLPCGILFPVGLALTYQAMLDLKWNDARFVEFVLLIMRLIMGSRITKNIIKFFHIIRKFLYKYLDKNI